MSAAAERGYRRVNATRKAVLNQSDDILSARGHPRIRPMEASAT